MNFYYMRLCITYCRKVPGILPMICALATSVLRALTSGGGSWRGTAGNPPGHMVFLRSLMYPATCSADVSQSLVSTIFLLIFPPASCFSSMGSCLRIHCPPSLMSNSSSRSSSIISTGRLSSSCTPEIKLMKLISCQGHNTSTLVTDYCIRN